MAGAIEYPVRTPAAYWVVFGALCALCLAAVGALLPYLRLASLSQLALLLGLAVAPALYLRVSREYRGSGAIRLALGSIVVPDLRGQPLTFTSEDVRVTVTPVTVRFTLFGIGVGDLARGKVIEVVGPAGQRRLSTLALAEPDHGEALIEDLERVLRGEAPRGPSAPPVWRPPKPLERYEEELERELAALD